MLLETKTMIVTHTSLSWLAERKGYLVTDANVPTSQVDGKIRPQSMMTDRQRRHQNSVETTKKK